MVVQRGDVRLKDDRQSIRMGVLDALDQTGVGFRLRRLIENDVRGRRRGPDARGDLDGVGAGSRDIQHCELSGGAFNLAVPFGQNAEALIFKHARHFFACGFQSRPRGKCGIHIAIFLAVNLTSVATGEVNARLSQNIQCTRFDRKFARPRSVWWATVYSVLLLITGTSWPIGIPTIRKRSDV